MTEAGGAEVLAQDFFLILIASTCMCVRGGGALAFGKTFQPFARKDRPTLWRVKP